MNIEIFKPLIKYIEDSDENFKKIETYKLLKNLYKLISNDHF